MSDAVDWERYEAEFTAADDGIDWACYEAEFADPDAPEGGDLLLAAGGGCALIDDLDWDRHEAELSSPDGSVNVDQLRSGLRALIALLDSPAGMGKTEFALLYAHRFAEVAETNPEFSGIEFSQRQFTQFLLRRVGVDRRHATLVDLWGANALIGPADVVAFMSSVCARTAVRIQRHRSLPQPSRPPGRLVARSRRPTRGPNRVQAPTVLPVRGEFTAA